MAHLKGRERIVFPRSRAGAQAGRSEARGDAFACRAKWSRASKPLSEARRPLRERVWHSISCWDSSEAMLNSPSQSSGLA